MKESSTKENSIKVRQLMLGDGIPKICIPVMASNLVELETQIEQTLNSPFDLIEWRADYYEGVEEPDAVEAALKLLREKLGEKPLLFTFRTKEEGGERSLPMEQYVQLNERAARSGLADLIDIELNRGEELAQSLMQSVQACGVRAVCSFHDFSGTPESERLIQIACKMQELGADVVKMAVMPKCREDVLRLLEVSVHLREQYADRPFITMSMGALGAVTRLAGAFSGSAVTFASAGRASAPGQIEARELEKVLRLLA